MEDYSTENDQLRRKSLRYLSIAFLIISLGYLIIKFRFYWLNGWFAKPTAIGFGILLFILITTISAFGIMFRQQNIHNWFSRQARSNSSLRLLINLVWITFVAISFITLLSSVYRGWKDQFDLFIFLSLILFLAGLTLDINYSDDHVHRIASIVSSLNFWKLALLFIGLTVGKILIITPYAQTLIAASDGFQYWSMANQLFNGSLDVENFHHYPPLYPMTISPAFLFGQRNSLAAISVINILLSSAAIIPVFYIARSLLSEKIAVLLALLTALNPFQWVYPAFPASENLFYLIFYCIIYLLLEKPRKANMLPWWNLLTGILIGLSWLTRYQTFPLIPIYLIAWWLKPVISGNGLDIRPSRDKIHHLLILLTGITFIFGLWVVAGALEGVPLREMTGFHIETGKIIREHPISLLFFWLSISLAFFVLMISPVLHLYITIILHIKSISRDQRIIRWLVLAFLSSGVLLFTIARHAWLANYNYEEPTRLIGRYAIYAEMVLIITSIELFSRIVKVSYKKYLLANFLSLALAYFFYQVFSNPNWIFPRESIFFLHLDGYTPLYLDWIFIILLLLGGLALGFSILKTNKEMQLVAIVLSVILFQAMSLPYYWESIITLENQGRYINEIVDQIINSEKFNPNPNDSVTIYYPETVKYLDRQFKVKGVDISNYSFEVLLEYPAKDQKCEPFIQIDLANGNKYGIMSRSRGCKLQPNQTIISEFTFNQRDYFLAPITR